MRRTLMLSAGAALVLALTAASTLVGGCSTPHTQLPAAIQVGSAATGTGTPGTPTATPTQSAATSGGATSGTPKSAASTAATPPKASGGATSAATVTKASTAAALQAAINATITKGSDAAAAKVFSVDVKVLEKGADGTWWAGADFANRIDGGTVFAKKRPGGSWVIVDLGTGIDGSDMVGKAPAAIAKKFEAAFAQ